MRTLKVAGSLLLSFVLFASVGCESMSEHKTATGAAIGTAAGAIVGGVIGHQSGHKTEGAVIGAAAGAALGGGIGYLVDRQTKKYNSVADNNVQVIPYSDPAPVYIPPTTPEATPQQVQKPHITLRLSGDVLFEKSSATLSAAGASKVREIAQIMNEEPESDVIVVGYASSEGNVNFNQTLSTNRANSVANALIANGVSSSRIRSMGMGISNPIGDNNTESGRAMNRRVEIEVIPRQ